MDITIRPSNLRLQKKLFANPSGLRIKFFPQAQRGSQGNMALAIKVHTLYIPKGYIILFLFSVRPSVSPLNGYAMKEKIFF